MCIQNNIVFVDYRGMTAFVARVKLFLPSCIKYGLIFGKKTKSLFCSPILCLLTKQTLDLIIFKTKKGNVKRVKVNKNEEESNSERKKTERRKEREEEKKEIQTFLKFSLPV